MVSHVSAFLVGGLGVVVGVFLLVLMVAGAANTPPAVEKALQWLWLLLLAGMAAPLIGFVWGLIARKPEIGLTAAVLGWLIMFCVFMAWWEMGTEVLEPGWEIRKGKVVLRSIVMLVFGGGGMIMFYVGAREGRVQKVLLNDAREVEVEITESYVKKLVSKPAGDRDLNRMSKETISWRPEVKFKYEVNGKTYESDTIKPTVIVQDFASEGRAQQEIAPYPVGAKLKGWVADREPTRGYLVREKSAGPVVFLIVGPLVGVVAMIIGRWL